MGIGQLCTAFVLIFYCSCIQRLVQGPVQTSRLCAQEEREYQRVQESGYHTLTVSYTELCLEDGYREETLWMGQVVEEENQFMEQPLMVSAL